MKLYNMPLNCKIVLCEDATVPPGDLELLNGTTVKFSHVDGMYSHCTTLDGVAVHPAAWTNVTLLYILF